jgi:hypothetical protein
MMQPDLMARCHAHAKSSGEQCKYLAMEGQRVCRIHGGKSPQALAKAEDRMRDLVHPAISSLQRLVEKDEFSATKYVLDWAGFRPASESSTPSEHAVEVTVVFDRAESTLSLPDARAD